MGQDFGAPASAMRLSIAGIENRLNITQLTAITKNEKTQDINKISNTFTLEYLH